MRRSVANLTARGGRRLAFVLLVSTVVGLVAAAINMGAISVPTSDRATTDLRVAAATSHVMLDMPDRSIVDRRAQAQELATLIKRAELMGRAMITPPVLADIGKRAGLPADAISGIARTTASVPIALTEPGSEQRADEIVEAKAPYRLEIQARPTSPILDVYALAPSVDEAIRLANAATLGLRDYLESLAHKQDFPADQLVELRQLGPARGASINGKTPLLITVLSFFTGFGLTCLTLLGLMRLMASRGSHGSGRRQHHRIRATHPVRTRASRPNESWATPTTGRTHRGSCRGCSPPSSPCCGSCRSTRSSSTPRSPST